MPGGVILMFGRERATVDELEKEIEMDGGQAEADDADAGS